jgi:hypothetical protein
MLERDSDERLDELAELDLARHRLRSLDHCPHIQLLNRCIDRCAPRSWGGLLTQPGMALVELPHFAQRAPAQIAVPGVAQIRIRDPLDAARADRYFAQRRFRLIAIPLLPYLFGHISFHC